GHHSRLHRAVDAGAQSHLTAIVEHADPIAVMNAAALGVNRVDLEQIRLFQRLHGLDVAERAVQEVVSLAGKQFQRELTGFLRVPRFGWRLKRSHGIEPGGSQRGAVKFSLAAGCEEVAFGEGKKRAFAYA